MTNWLEENVTDLSDSKLLKEHGIMDMDFADLYWVMNDEKQIFEPWGVNRFDKHVHWEGHHTLYYYNAYRLDKLLAKVKKQKLPMGNKKRDQAEILLEQIKLHLNLFAAKGVIKLAIKACVSLLVLLKAERSEDKKEGVE